jgi:hypothetical protein
LRRLALLLPRVASTDLGKNRHISASISGKLVPWEPPLLNLKKLQQINPASTLALFFRMICGTQVNLKPLENNQDPGGPRRDLALNRIPNPVRQPYMVAPNRDLALNRIPNPVEATLFGRPPTAISRRNRFPILCGNPMWSPLAGARHPWRPRAKPDSATCLNDRRLVIWRS